MRFEWANRAAEALGCEYEELNTATFKHHLRQIIEQVTSGPNRRGLEDEETSSGTTLLPPRVGRVPAGPAPGALQRSLTCPSGMYQGSTISGHCQCEGGHCWWDWPWAHLHRGSWSVQRLQRLLKPGGGHCAAKRGHCRQPPGVNTFPYAGPLLCREKTSLPV